VTALAGETPALPGVIVQGARSIAPPAAMLSSTPVDMLRLKPEGEEVGGGRPLGWRPRTVAT